MMGQEAVKQEVSQTETQLKKKNPLKHFFYCESDLFFYIFMVRVIEHRLPKEIVEHPSLVTLKSCLVMVLGSWL